MSMHTTFLPALSAFALATMAAGGASGYRSTSSQAVTSAKFNCGTATALGDVVPGTYATSFNIHNPQQSQAVQFTKTIVQALEEGSTGTAKSFSTTDTLQPGPKLVQTNLVLDIPMLATITDPEPHNPSGVSHSATSPFWRGIPADCTKGDTL